MGTFTTRTLASEDIADHPLASRARAAAVESWRMLAVEEGHRPISEPTVVLLPDHSWEITGEIED